MSWFSWPRSSPRKFRKDDILTLDRLCLRYGVQNYSNLPDASGGKVKNNIYIKVINGVFEGRVLKINLFRGYIYNMDDTKVNNTSDFSPNHTKFIMTKFINVGDLYDKYDF